MTNAGIKRVGGQALRKDFESGIIDLEEERAVCP
jgi:hypothetical protein